MPEIHMMEQRSEEWYDIRRGKLTASRLYDAVGKTKAGKFYAARDKYMTELVMERLGVSKQSFSTGFMEQGSDREAEARDLYQYLTGNKIEEVGFVEHGSIDHYGCSPDGFVGKEGLVEIKCLAPQTHMQYLVTNEIDPQYIYQMDGQIEICERKWCDFVLYCPDMPPPYHIWIRRRHYELAWSALLTTDAIEFLHEVAKRHEAMTNVEPIADVA